MKFVGVEIINVAQSRDLTFPDVIIIFHINIEIVTQDHLFCEK